MLENLIDNAMKVTQAGRVELAVDRLDSRSGFEAIRFAVTDTGPGLTAEQSAQLFRAYSRLADGLPARARPVDGPPLRARHGRRGRLRFRARRGRHLLVHAAAQACDGRPGAGRILVVDDNHANRMIMGAVLEHFGHAMVEAASAEEALELCPPAVRCRSSGSYVAGLSGLEALKLIRAMPDPLRSLPVIPVTGVSPAPTARPSRPPAPMGSSRSRSRRGRSRSAGQRSRRADRRGRLIGFQSGAGGAKPIGLWPTISPDADRPRSARTRPAAWRDDQEIAFATRFAHKLVAGALQTRLGAPPEDRPARRRGCRPRAGCRSRASEPVSLARVSPQESRTSRAE